MYMKAPRHRQVTELSQNHTVNWDRARVLFPTFSEFHRLDQAFSKLFEHLVQVEESCLPLSTTLSNEQSHHIWVDQLLHTYTVIGLPI